MRRPAAALAVAAALAWVLPSAAAAAPLTLKVLNTRGVEQASLVQRGSQTVATNGHGRVVLDASPGQALRVNRGALAPEGAGVPYTVPSGAERARRGDRARASPRGRPGPRRHGGVGCSRA